MRGDNRPPRLIHPLGRSKRAVWRIPTRPFTEAHFAVYPPDLIKTPIMAGCPELVCKKCGKPTEKIIEQNGNGKRQKASGMDRWVNCDCWAGYEPGIVLDPFMGSGTTALVSQQLRRRFIGIELKTEYIRIAERRLRI
jgi:site-specific DNA-methyltransferase (adenine-specific)